MDLEQQVARAVEERTEFLDGWTADLADVRRQVRRRARVRLAVIGGAVAVAVVVAVALTAPSRPARDSTPPVVQQDDVPTIPIERPDKVVLTFPDSGVSLNGIRLRGESVSNDPAYDGSGELSLTVDASGMHATDVLCRGDRDTYWSLTVAGKHGGSGRCEDPWTKPTWEGLWSPALTDDSWARNREVTARVVLLDKDPKRYRVCRQQGSADCARLKAERVPGAGMRLGLRIYDRPADPVGARVDRFDVAAVTDSFGQVLHRLTEVVAAPDDALRMVHTLLPSDRERIVVVPATSGELGVLSLEIDGTPADPAVIGDFGIAAAARIPAGGEHDVVVEATGFTPDFLGFVVYEKVDR